MRSFFLSLIFCCVLGGTAAASGANVQWLGHADGCDYQYANVDGVVTENVVECTIKWRYPNRPANTTQSRVDVARVYDLRLGMICTMGGYRATGISMCRTVEELRVLNNPYAAELIRRFDWLVKWMTTSETDPRPRLEEFTACARSQ